MNRLNIKEGQWWKITLEGEFEQLFVVTRNGGLLWFKRLVDLPGTDENMFPTDSSNIKKAELFAYPVHQR